MPSANYSSFTRAGFNLLIFTGDMLICISQISFWIVSAAVVLNAEGMGIPMLRKSQEGINATFLSILSEFSVVIYSPRCLC